MKDSVLDLISKTESPSSLESLNLDGLSLEYLTDLKLLPNLRQLDLSFNKLSNLDFLSDCPPLLELYLTYNGLTSIESLNSTNISKLRTLDLSYNKLTSSPDLSRASNLVSLNLSNNSISSIEIPFFTSSICTLDLSQNNISYISDEFILSLTPSLHELYLQDNRLSTLPHLSHLKHLKELDVSSNHLSSLSFISSSLDSLHTLHFNLQSPPLKSFDLPQLPSLSELSSSHNDLQLIPHLPSLCPSLEVLLLEGNPSLVFTNGNIGSMILGLRQLFRLDIDLGHVSIQSLTQLIPSLDIINGIYISSNDDDDDFEVSTSKVNESVLSTQIMNQLEYLNSFKFQCDSLKSFCNDLDHRSSLLKTSSLGHVPPPPPLTPFSSFRGDENSLPALSPTPMSRRSPLRRRNSVAEGIGISQRISVESLKFDEEVVDLNRLDFTDEYVDFEREVLQLIDDVRTDLSPSPQTFHSNPPKDDLFDPLHLLSLPLAVDFTPVTHRVASPLEEMAMRSGKQSPLITAEEGLRKLNGRPPRRAQSGKVTRHPKVKVKAVQKDEKHQSLFSWG
ncbi:hypothetical protein GEMRC1_012536 [Eukaryota sp. GEM-RC1]